MGRKKYIVLTVIWLTSIAITWQIAKNKTISKLDKSDKLSSSAKSKNDKAGSIKRIIHSIHNSSPDSSNRRISIQAHKQKVNAAVLIESLKEKVAFDNDNFIIKNVRSMSLFLEECNEDELIAIIEMEKPKTGENWDLLNMLAYSKLSETQPKTAFELSNKLGEELDIVAIEFIDSWSKRDPIEALNYSKENGIIHESSYTILFKNVSIQNYDRALSEIDSLNYESKSYAISGIANTLKTPDEFNHLINSTDDNLNSHILVAWAERSPLDAINWTENSSSEKASEFKSNITRAWLQNEPTKAADWIIANSTNEQETYNHIVQNWDYDRQEDLINYLDNRPHSKIIDQTFLKMIISQDSYYSRSALEKIRDPNLRNKAAKQVFVNLLRSEEGDAYAFLIENKDLSEEEKKDLKDKHFAEDSTIDIIE